MVWVSKLLPEEILSYHLARLHERVIGMGSGKQPALNGGNMIEQVTLDGCRYYWSPTSAAWYGAHGKRGSNIYPGDHRTAPTGIWSHLFDAAKAQGIALTRTDLFRKLAENEGEKNMRKCKGQSAKKIRTMKGALKSVMIF